MKNDEGEFILDEDVNDFDKLSLRTATSSLESQIHTNAENNISIAFRNFELKETPETLENKSLTMVSHLNPQITFMLESEKGFGEQEKTESISKLESSYYELQAKLESAEAQHVRDRAEIDSLHSQVELRH